MCVSSPVTGVLYIHSTGYSDSLAHLDTDMFSSPVA